MIPEGLYDQRPGTIDTYQILVVNEGEHPLLQDAGRTMTGELVKPDLLTVLAPPPLTLQAMEEPPKPLDMQQLWEELEMPSNEFLQKDSLLRKEVWKLLYEYQDLFSRTPLGCTDIMELQLHL